MLQRMRVLGARLARYWRPWRLGVIGLTALLVVLAVIAGPSWLAALLAVAALGPLMLLLGLAGTRQADHHRQLRKLEEAVAAFGRMVERVEQSAAAEREAGARARRHLASASLLPRRGEVSIVVPGRADDAFAGFLTMLAEQMPDSVECVVLDDSEGPWLGRLGSQLQDEWRGLRLVAADPAGPLEADIERAIAATSGRYLLVLAHAALTPTDADTVLELCAHVPSPREGWVAARTHPAAPRFALVNRAVMADVAPGLWAGVSAEMEAVLAQAGFVCDVAEPELAGGGRQRLITSAPRHQLAGGVALMPQAAYHTAELFPLAEALGAPTVDLGSGVVVSERWWKSVRESAHRSPVTVYDQPRAGAWVSQLAALVTMNDWARDERAIVDAARSYGVVSFAKVEGVQDFDDVDTDRERRPYRRVDHVLCQGPNDVDAVTAFGGHPHLVGSSRLEQAWSAEPRPAPTTPLVVINLNFTWGVLDRAREAFLATAVEACRSAGLGFVVSAHPFEEPPADLPVATEPFSDLIERASVLVSRFSTVPFEAMARGVPFVYHNPHGEQVPTFREARGAFEITHDASSLRDALDDALTWVDSYRTRCETFFRRQVDIDPSASPAERAARVIADVVGAASGCPAR